MEIRGGRNNPLLRDDSIAQHRQVQTPETPEFRVTLCRYESDKLVKAKKFLDEIEYVAISHVWGITGWRSIPGLETDVLASHEKVRFLVDELPAIIGGQWFWMDILCIDQRNENERVTVTQYIPAIFRLALRTLAVRDSTGIRICCSDAMSHVPAIQKSSDPGLFQHWISHPTHAPTDADGFLTRVWPLQEILLSDNIQFVQCKRPEEQKSSFMHVDRLRSTLAAVDGLFSLAKSWWLHGGKFGGPPDAQEQFVHAFIKGGTVSRWPVQNPDDWFGSIDLSFHIHSCRRTSKPQDYILAIMPPYYWYSVPVDARRMTFSELFLDCCAQVEQKESGLIRPLITSGWANIPDVILNPSKPASVPTPTCLGDLAKLFSGGLSRYPSIGKIRLHPAEASQVDNIPTVEILQLIKQSIQFSEGHWLHCLPYPIFDMEDTIESDPRWMESCWCFEDIQLHAVKFLTLMFGANFGMQPTHPDIMKSWRWEEACLLLEDRRSYMDSLLRFTAIISCGLGLSAFAWSKDNMTPLKINFDGSWLLALAPNANIKRDTKYFILKSKGEDCLIAQNPKDQNLYCRCLLPQKWIVDYTQ